MRRQKGGSAVGYLKQILPITLFILDNRSRTEKTIMKSLKKETKIERPARAEVSREEALKRMKSLPKRREKIIAAIRKGSR